VTVAALVAALIRDPEVSAALRDALGARDAAIPLASAAAEVGTTVRALRETARHKDAAKRLAIEGPRSARVVRRSELDRWLAATAPRVRAPWSANDQGDDASAFAASVARVGRRHASR